MFGNSYFGNTYFADPYFGPKTIVPTGGKTRDKKKWEYHEEDEEFYRLLSRMPAERSVELNPSLLGQSKSLSDITDSDEMALILAIYESLD